VAANPEWGDGVILVLAVATSLLFFVSLLLHELAHSFSGYVKQLASERDHPVRPGRRFSH